MSLLLANVLNFSGAAQRLDNLRFQSNENIEVICTGKQMRWIDTLASQTAGKFIFIEPPSDVPESDKNMRCDCCVWHDIYMANFVIVKQVSQALTDDATTLLLSADIRQAQYANALSRAPPLFLS